MKSWDDYQLLLALKRTGTIRGAGQLLGVNHSTVSRRLAQVERKLNNSMFEKAARGKCRS
ncbi:MAG: DNA-binding transcriptional LysR family regulator [Alphaproteobacteria bacterium]|jgi:DNA-binding transcriptional LysR family regulator